MCPEVASCVGWTPAENNLTMYVAHQISSFPHKDQKKILIKILENKITRDEFKNIKKNHKLKKCSTPTNIDDECIEEIIARM